MVRVTALERALGLIRAAVRILEVARTQRLAPAREIALIQVALLILTTLIPIMGAALDWEA